MVGQLFFEDVDPNEQPQFKGSAWRNSRIAPKSMCIIGPLGEFGVRQRVDVRRERNRVSVSGTPRGQTVLAPTELKNKATDDPYDRPASAPLIHPSQYRRKARSREGPAIEKNNLKVLERLHEESCMKKDKLDNERGPPLPIETLQAWESEHQHDYKEIEKLRSEHALIQTKISAQAEGINRLVGQRAADTEKHANEMSYMVTQHEKVVVEMNAQHAVALKRLMETQEEDLAAERAKRKEIETTWRQKAKQVELDTTQEYEHRISDLTARYEERISSTAKFHEFQMKDQVEKLRREVHQLHEEAEQQVDEFMGDDIAKKYQRQVKDMQMKHKAELEEMKQQCANEVSVLKVQYEAAIMRGDISRSSTEDVPKQMAMVSSLEEKVKSLEMEVTNWRTCAEEASRAASNTEEDLKLVEKRYGELKLQLVQGTQDEITFKQTSHEALAWERKFMELQSQYDKLQLQLTQRGNVAAHWEQQFLELQRQYDKLKLETIQGSQQEAAGQAASTEAGRTEVDAALAKVYEQQAKEIEAARADLVAQHKSDIASILKENDALRRRLADLESRAGVSTAASTPLPENYRSIQPTPQPLTTPTPGLQASSSSSTPAPTQDPSPVPQDLTNALSWTDMQNVLSEMSTEDLLKMTGRNSPDK